MNLTPLTVDAYQGLEKDVIIISNARTRGCGFLTNYQRLNVALTRPKRCLVICGNFDDLKASVQNEIFYYLFFNFYLPPISVCGHVAPLTRRRSQPESLL